MNIRSPGVDAVIIGGGYYGCEIALELKRIGFQRVIIFEREKGIMRRASYVNQARIHNGYHYPRSLSTAERSHNNFERFLFEYEDAIYFKMEKIYAIAFGSRINANQYERFCSTVGIPCRLAPPRLSRLLDSSLIEAAFLTREFAFDAQIMAESLARQLGKAGVDLRLGTEVRVDEAHDDRVAVSFSGGTIDAAYVFNCTYAELDLVGVPLRSTIKRELTEMLLIDPPRDLDGLGVTVMDGPFFSTMPFPAARLHSLSHVRYTPHEAWYEGFEGTVVPHHSSRDAMMRDASRYLPCLEKSEIIRSLFDLKAVLLKNEDDDGRPILFEKGSSGRRVFSIMGSKFDNIYDVQENLRAQRWEL